MVNIIKCVDNIDSVISACHLLVSNLFDMPCFLQSTTELNGAQEWCREVNSLLEWSMGYTNGFRKYHSCNLRTFWVDIILEVLDIVLVVFLIIPVWPRNRTQGHSLVQ